MKKPAILNNGNPAEYCGGLMTHKLHGMDVFGHGGADAAYRGQIICIPQEELEVILMSDTTPSFIQWPNWLSKAACIVLGLPDCTEPILIPEHTTISAYSSLS